MCLQAVKLNERKHDQSHAKFCLRFIQAYNTDRSENLPAGEEQQPRLWISQAFPLMLCTYQSAFESWAKEPFLYRCMPFPFALFPALFPMHQFHYYFICSG